MKTKEEVIEMLRDFVKEHKEAHKDGRDVMNSTESAEIYTLITILGSDCPKDLRDYADICENASCINY